jgi:hypothetical protein
LQERLSGVDLRGFDEGGSDLWFAHTFENLPAGISEAHLRIRLRATADNPQNDTIQLLFTGPGGSALPQDWTRRIGSGFDATPGLLNNAWSPGAQTELVLDLSRLPNANNTTTDLLPTLRTQRYLDLIVQDDTMVDYVILEIATCHCRADIVVQREAQQCGATVTFATPVFVDACDTNLTTTCSPPSGSFFPVGATVVACTAVDHSGNRAACSFTVTVTDAPISLSIQRSGENVVIRWPVTCVNYTLEGTPSLNPPIHWTPVMAPVGIANGQYQVTVPANGVQRYFRLRR